MVSTALHHMKYLLQERLFKNRFEYELEMNTKRAGKGQHDWSKMAAFALTSLQKRLHDYYEHC